MNIPQTELKCSETILCVLHMMDWSHPVTVWSCFFNTDWVGLCSIAYQQLWTNSSRLILSRSIWLAGWNRIFWNFMFAVPIQWLMNIPQSEYHHVAIPFLMRSSYDGFTSYPASGDFSNWSSNLILLFSGGPAQFGLIEVDGSYVK